MYFPSAFSEVRNSGIEGDPVYPCAYFRFISKCRESLPGLCYNLLKQVLPVFCAMTVQAAYFMQDPIMLPDRFEKMLLYLLSSQRRNMLQRYQ